MSTFQEWLGNQIAQSGMSYREVARKGDITHARISQVLNGESPGAEFCIGIAKGLSLPANIVLEKAGLIPTAPGQVEGEQQALFLYRLLGVELRRSIIATMQNLAGIQVQGSQGAKHTTEPQQTARDHAAHRLVQELEQLTPDERELIMSMMTRLKRLRKAGGKEERAVKRGLAAENSGGVRPG